MRETTYVPGYGYVTEYTEDEYVGHGIMTDMAKQAAINISKKVVGAIGDKIGQKIADKIIGKPSRDYAKTRKDVLKEIEIIPYNEGKGLPKNVRHALYDSPKVVSKRKQIFLI